MVSLVEGMMVGCAFMQCMLKQIMTTIKIINEEDTSCKIFNRSMLSLFEHRFVE